MPDFYQLYPWVLSVNGTPIGRFKDQADAKALYLVRAEAQGHSHGLALMYVPWAVVGTEEPIPRRGHLREQES